MWNLATLIEWMKIGQRVIEVGMPLWNDIKLVLANHGVEADSALLEQVIEDAARRQALAEAEAGGGQ
jgi:hypothetical protein